MKKILITGGHAAIFALATIEEIQKRDKEIKISWVGAKSAIEGQKVIPIEQRIFPLLDVKCYEIRAGKIQTKFTKHTLLSLFKIPLGFWDTFFVLQKTKPDVILSFGGFAAFPVVLLGFLKNIPIYVHEQTTTVGLSNKVSSFFAKKIAIARKSSAKYFPQQKIVLTGNPILKSILQVKIKNKISEKKNIFITTGSRGSVVINDTLLESLEDILKKHDVYHITGKNDFEKFDNFKKGLNKNLQKKYSVYEFINPLEIHKFYELSDIIISRGGATTVAEILITQRPAIIVPIPWTRSDEQTKNALLAQKSGVAIYLQQDKLNKISLTKALFEIEKNYEKMSSSKSDISDLDRNGAKNLVDLIFNE